MNLQLEYRGYQGSASYNLQTGKHYGLIMGIPDRVLYEASALESLVANFEAATDEYIDLLTALPSDDAHSFDPDVRRITVVIQDRTQH